MVMVLFTPNAWADSFTLSVNGGTNRINASNQSTVIVSGKLTSGTFVSGEITATLTDSVGTTRSGIQNLPFADRGNYSISLDTTSLVDGSISVFVERHQEGMLSRARLLSSQNKQ